MKIYLFVLVQMFVAQKAFSGAEAILGGVNVFGTINVAITQSKLEKSDCGTMQNFYYDPSCFARPNHRGQYADPRIEGTLDEAMRRADLINIEVTSLSQEVLSTASIRPRDLLNNSNCSSVNQFVAGECEVYPNAPKDIRDLEMDLKGRGASGRIARIDGLNLNESVEIFEDRSCRFLGPANSFMVYQKPSGCGSSGPETMEKVCEAIVECGENSLLQTPTAQKRFPNARPGVPMAVRCTESSNAGGNSVSGCQMTTATCLMDSKADELMSVVVDPASRETNTIQNNGAARR